LEPEESHSSVVFHHPSGKVVVTVEEHKPGVGIDVDVVAVVAEACGVHPRKLRTHFLVVVAAADGANVEAVPANVDLAFRCWGCKWDRRLRRSCRPDNLGMKYRDLLRTFWTGTWPRIEQREQPQ